ncbi:MAG: hypothetical protein QXN16_02710 [Candidatus Micrarchaeaceae archaeon]
MIKTGFNVVLEKVIMYAELDKTRPAKLKRIRLSGEKEYMMTVSKARPLITFKDMTNRDIHYTMLIRAVDQRTFEIDFHKTFEGKEVRHDPIIKVMFRIKEGIQNIEEKIGTEMKDAMLSVIHPLTEEELDTVVYWLPGEDMYYTKESTISDKNMYKSTLRKLQESGNFKSGIAEQNGNKIVIFLKDGRYHKFDFMELVDKTTDIFDRIVDLTLVINEVEKKQSFKEFMTMAKANAPRA